VRSSGESFEAALDAARQARGSSPAGEAQAAAGARAADPIAELARAVRGGEISKEQALERLIDRVAGGVDHVLSATQRAELVAVLRASLQNDPALSALRDALE
jgi:hypothetical protein